MLLKDGCISRRSRQIRVALSKERDDILWEEQTNHRGLGSIILQKILQQVWIMEASGEARPNHASHK
jgi:hypothetical protein